MVFILSHSSLYVLHKTQLTDNLLSYSFPRCGRHERSHQAQPADIHSGTTRVQTAGVQWSQLRAESSQ